MMIPRNFTKLLRSELASGKILDEALTTLRADGASKIDCIVALRAVRQYGLGEAKWAVHQSRAWADVRQRDEAIWDELISDNEKA